MKKKIIITFFAWFFSLLIFFPILWMIITSFKTEIDAVAIPPLFFSFEPTLENYGIVQERSNYLKFAQNSVIISFGSSILGLVLSIPIAWSMAFHPTKRTKGTLLWILSTKMMPPVGVLIPIYLIFRDLSLLDTKLGIVIVLCFVNLPIMIWLLYSYFKEIPNEILEAVRIDGASTLQEILYVLVPLSLPGIASTSLLCIVLAWNEAFWTLNLTSIDAAPLTTFIASYSSPEGLFYAKLSAASTLSVLPVLFLGWFTQKQLVRGLTFGAVK
ncbi:carbohydrate ABC transporter permease [Candidatus Pelagibacter sp. HIMB1611]|uniref:carbohydrate ABC transporter permease n=1 Tax=unclassified Candidatus Pelagibacter TaxID=2647897 RepID=UPI003F83752E